MPFPDDDYASDTSTTAELVIGGTINGKIDYGYDRDMIKVWLQAGVSYLFSLADNLPYQFAANKMGLILSDAKGILARVDGTDNITGPAFEFTPATSGLYYLDVHSYYNVTGGYALSGAIKPPDPIASDIHTTGVLTAGQTVRGVFEVAGDTDWYKIHVEAGQHYGFSLPAEGATISVNRFQIYDASGKPVTDYILEPAVAGDYFIGVSGNLPGDYNLKAMLLDDDYSQNHTAPGVLPPGGAISGTIQYGADSDRFTMQVEAGKIYTLQLAGSTADLRTLKFELYDEAGNVIGRLGEQYYDDGPRIFGFTAAASGTYSVLVSSSSASLTRHRDYTLSASAGVDDDAGDTAGQAKAATLGATIHGVNTYQGDTDVFKLLLSAGTTYALQLRPDAGDTKLLSSLSLAGADGVKVGSFYGADAYTYTPSVSGYYYASISASGAAHYQLTPVEAADDWGANVAKAGWLSPGAGATGTLQAGGGDRDWFALDMRAGETVGIALQSAPGSATPMFTYTQYPYTLSVVDGQGQVLATVKLNAGSEEPLLAFTSTNTGRYYVEVGAPGGYAGDRSYLLSTSSVARDDVGNTAAGAALLTDNVAVKGTLEVSSDVDMYKLSVTAGHTYAIQFSASSLLPGRWPDVDLSATDAGGTVYLRSVRGNSGASGGESLLYTASKDGELYLKVNERYGDPVSGYQLSATSLGADDYANSSITTAVLPVGGALRGTLGYADDVDMVKLTLEAGRSYQFNLLDKGDGQGTLPDHSARLTLYTANGGEIYDSVKTSGATLGYTAPKSGDYYLAVGASYSNTYAIGTYALQAAALAPAPLLQGPASGAPGLQRVTDKIALDFNQPVRVLNGSDIKLVDSAGKSWSIYNDSSNTALTTHLLLDPSLHLEPGTTYTLNIAPGAIVDAAGHGFAGLQGYTVATTPTAPAGTDGNDYLLGSGNGAILRGGAGTDTVIYNGSGYSPYLTRVNGHVEVRSYANYNQPDQLYDIERLIFRDTAIALDIDGVGGQAYRLYQAAFNRTPDKAGLGFWIDLMDRGLSLQQVSSNFIASTEFIGRYGAAPSDESFVTLLYNNVLHREPEAAGREHWLNLLDGGANRADVLLSFSESAENQAALIGRIGNGFEYTVYGG